MVGYSGKWCFRTIERHLGTKGGAIKINNCLACDMWISGVEGACCTRCAILLILPGIMIPSGYRTTLSFGIVGINYAT